MYENSFFLAMTSSFCLLFTFVVLVYSFSYSFVRHVRKWTVWISFVSCPPMLPQYLIVSWRQQVTDCLIISMYVSELRPPTNLFFIPQVICE
jgi:hypothetical protein